VQTTLRKSQEEIIDHYTALSYVWGDAADRVLIQVGQQTLEVTTSLECALRHLRDERRVLRLWVDGICINQADDEEKAKQVEQMGRSISVHHTVIFLGKCDEAAESVVFEALQHCKEAPQIEEGLPERAFKQLFWRPWFYRVWVLQELVLSRDPWYNWAQSASHGVGSANLQDSWRGKSFRKL
jgi:hypothetical protein